MLLRALLTPLETVHVTKAKRKRSIPASTGTCVHAMYIYIRHVDITVIIYKTTSAAFQEGTVQFNVK